MFILYPVEGLANRMRAIDSAVRYCSEQRIKYRVKWYRDPSLCDCRWSDIFKQRKNFSDAGKGYDVLQFVYKLKRHSKLFCKFLALLEKLHVLAIFGPDDYDELRAATAAGKHYIWMIAQSFSAFYWPDGADFQRNLFALSDELQKRVDAEVARFGGNAVGVHIRRTDHKIAIDESPLELFEKEIASRIAEDPSVTFYVCSDDADVKDSLMKAFGPDHIVLPTGVLARNSAEGIKQAIVEMFSMASTKSIIGSAGSSFSSMASHVGHIPIKRMKK